MQSNLAELENQQADDRQQLESSLNNWRECVLRFLRDEMVEANEEARVAEDGLGIAHRNQGEVADDVVRLLWDQLEDASTRFSMLARVSDRIAEMDLPELLTLFAQTEKINTWPWEGEAWQLPSLML